MMMMMDDDDDERMMTSTERVVQEALRQEDEEKKLRKKTKKKKREEEEEEEVEEVGRKRNKAIRSSSGFDDAAAASTFPSTPRTLVSASEAHKRRTAARKGKGIVTCEEDLGLGTLEAAEEIDEHHHQQGQGVDGGAGTSSGLGFHASTVGSRNHKREEEEEEEEEEEKFTAFNLEEERTEGRFDKEGNYYWNEEDKEDKEDAWLKGVEVLDQSKVSSKKKMEEEEKEEGEEEPAMTERQVAHLNMKIADILQEGETVREGLIRLGGGRDGGKKKKKKSTRGLPPALRRQLEQDESQSSAGNKVDFDELTAASTTLISSGELDVYSKTKADFEKSASLFMTRGEDGSGGPNIQGEEDDGDDMFAEEEEDDGGGGGGGGEVEIKKNGNENRGSGGSEAPKVAAAEKEEQDKGVGGEVKDCGAWPVSKLKEFLQERGEDLRGVAEKQELVERTRLKLEQEAKAPQGFVWDPHSGYYFSQSKQLYFDPVSAYYYNGSEWIKEIPP